MITEYLFAFIIVTIMIISIWYANNILYENDNYNINNNYTYGENQVVDKTPSNIYPKIVINNNGSGSKLSSISLATNLNIIKKPPPPPKPSYPKIIMGSQYTYIDQPLPEINYNSFKDPNPLDLVQNNNRSYEYEQELKNINVPSDILLNKAQSSLVFFEDDTVVSNTSLGYDNNINLDPIIKYYKTHNPNNLPSGFYSPNTNTYNPNKPPPMVGYNDGNDMYQTSKDIIPSNYVNPQNTDTRSGITSGNINITRNTKNIDPMFIYNTNMSR